MLILNVNNVSKDFGYGTLFEDVSFSLNEKESISIVGPNGCGKSTLLKIIVVLKKAINDFKGTLIFVSNIRYFINKYADKVLEFKKGNINCFYGNYDYYKEKR